MRPPFERTIICRSTDSRRARNSASVMTGRRRPASRPSRRRCFLASSRVEPLTFCGSVISSGSRGVRTLTTVLAGSLAPSRPVSPARRRERRRTPAGLLRRRPRGSGGSGRMSGAWKSRVVGGRPGAAAAAGTSGSPCFSGSAGGSRPEASARAPLGRLLGRGLGGLRCGRRTSAAGSADVLQLAGPGRRKPRRMPSEPSSPRVACRRAPCASVLPSPCSLLSVLSMFSLSTIAGALLDRRGSPLTGCSPSGGGACGAPRNPVRMPPGSWRGLHPALCSSPAFTAGIFTDALGALKPSVGAPGLGRDDCCIDYRMRAGVRQVASQDDTQAACHNPKVSASPAEAAYRRPTALAVFLIIAGLIGFCRGVRPDAGQVPPARGPERAALLQLQRARGMREEPELLAGLAARLPQPAARAGRMDGHDRRRRRPARHPGAFRPLVLDRVQRRRAARPGAGDLPDHRVDHRAERAVPLVHGHLGSSPSPPSGR